mmetsp:Transcript_71808/g.126805  ORF Transcript_71808/g.126805 Transcript_71808/m.126805 type:complete len:704 (+) Transcript_71808:157-2268(+)|eukprot:CAMPEP_0197685810 /NCGR_PEP_ID=MMETSP1338-20131121/101510_1 /TAXON_ID=43686 ORGANISM="Pelagodinium beii, Strain RCC1491" /NCGR_SAMPLE_ID=MMETSP1338 /ASSEMBLY_ACC=CAM_ASM_000754 /LENGTH=703 /DNA_ID=CAMNT_0043267675 /DNA_START=99 /DNA_END=2210 /DNA_ORIENTATION=+
MSVFAKQLSGKNAPGSARGSAGYAGAAQAKAKAAQSKTIAAPAPKSGKAAAAKPVVKAKAKATGPQPPRPSSAGEQEADGVMTCANRSLLMQMLEGVVDEDEDDEKENESDDGGNAGNGLNMSLRNVSTAIQKASGPRAVPTITGPPSAIRPVSRGGVPTIASPSFENRPPSRGGLAERPVSRGGLSHAPMATRPAPAASMQQVTTGPPRTTAVSYVSVPRPGSRGAGMPEAVQSPAGTQQGAQRALPQQRPSAVLQTGAPAAAVRAPPGSYGSMHQANRERKAPAQPKPAPAARPLCGPSAFDFLKQLDAKAAEAPAAGEEKLPDLAEVLAEDDGDEGFMMPDSDDESDAPVKKSSQLAPDKPAVVEDVAADYVDKLKRGMGMPTEAKARAPQMPPPPAGDVASAFAELGLPMPGTGQGAAPAVRARSVDARQDAGGAIATAGNALHRSRSSDPRAAVAAARAASAQNSEDEDDDDDEESGAGMQWKSDVRNMVKSFAQEERAKEKASRPAAMRSAGENQAAKKPPRAPAAGRAAEEETTVSSKKPRAPVEYTPATVDDYKQRFGAAKPEKSELGKLGPDLDDDNLMMKKAVQEKVKQFSKELHRINRQRSDASEKSKQPPPKPEPKPNARSKALEFAKNVPKPKVAPKPQVVTTPASPTKKEVEKEQDEADWEEIRRREKQHLEDAAKVMQIKEFIAKLPF